MTDQERPESIDFSDELFKGGANPHHNKHKADTNTVNLQHSQLLRGVISEEPSIDQAIKYVIQLNGLQVSAPSTDIKKLEEQIQLLDPKDRPLAEIVRLAKNSNENMLLG